MEHFKRQSGRSLTSPQSVGVQERQILLASPPLHKNTHRIITANIFPCSELSVAFHSLIRHAGHRPLFSHNQAPPNGTAKVSSIARSRNSSKEFFGAEMAKRMETHSYRIGGACILKMRGKTDAEIMA